MNSALISQAASSLAKKLMQKKDEISEPQVHLDAGPEEHDDADPSGYDDIVRRKAVISSGHRGVVAPPLTKRRKSNVKRADTTGSGWFDMPAKKMTPEELRDIKMLRMRGYVDPKRHYRRPDGKKLPKYFQVGTVVSAPQEFYSSYVPRKHRVHKFADEFLKDEKVQGYAKRRFDSIIEQAQKGGKKAYLKRRRRK